MIEIVPIKERKTNQDDTDSLFYIENSQDRNSMTEKYNYAIENIILKQKDDIICFRHEDTEIRTSKDICNYKLSNLFNDKKMGCAGLIGTIILEKSCVWWTPNRPLNTSGYIIQGGVRPKKDNNGKDILNSEGKPVLELFEYPMNEHIGIHDYLATVDGCCLFFPKRIFEQGIRFDTNIKEYHFYDVDICLQLLSKGYKVSTIDILVKHQSSGIPSQNFNELKKYIFEKWDKKIKGDWPITKNTKFYE